MLRTIAFVMLVPAAAHAEWPEANRAPRPGLPGELGGYVEPGVEITAAGDGSSNPFVGAGLTYAVTKFLVVDAAFYVADEPRTQFFAGLTYAMYVPPR